MSDSQKYTERLMDIQKKASSMRDVLVNPQMGDNGFISDTRQRNENIQNAVSGSIFESAGSAEAGGFIAATNANAIRSYEARTGKKVSSEIMANAFEAISNLFGASDNSTVMASNGGVFESVKGMGTTEGIIMRDHMAALVMPVMLNMITNDMVTTVPGNFDRTEIFRINRRAGSTFGDLVKGDLINETFGGQYSAMDMIKCMVGDIDGTNVDFTYDAGMALKRGGNSAGGYVKILIDRNVAGQDDGKGNIFGLGIAPGSTVNYDTGLITVKLVTAPATGLEVHTMFDVDIEKDPTKIPFVEHSMSSVTILPHESAISGMNTVQAMFGLRREFNVDSNNLNLTTMRNVLSADKDRKRLNLMYYAAKGTTTFNAKLPTGLSQRDHYETVRETLLIISTELLSATLKSGLVGIIAGNDAARLFRSLPASAFTPAPGYREIPQPHYVGKLFGVWDLYCDPQAEDPTKALCYAKGRNYGDAGIVAADVLTAIPFTHDTRGTNLQQRDTLWDLAYRDIHPDNGRAYFTWLKIDPTQ